MGWIKDALTEVPLSAVLKERVALADQKYEQALAEVDELRAKVAALEGELEELRATNPSTSSGEMNDDTISVLVFLFENDRGDRDEGALAQALQMPHSVAKYHLEQLEARDLAVCTGGNYITGEVFWALTADGRRHVVESGLVS